MNEIRISQENGKIYCNFEDAKKFLNEQLEVYNKMVFTEQTKADAKKTVADLRKLKKEFADRVKEVKNEFLIPLNEFLEKANELSALFDEPIVFIVDQIEAFEEQRKEEKKAECIKAYEELVPEEEWREYLPFSKVFDDKWLNATVNMKQIKEQIMAKKVAVKEAVTAIKESESECVDKALELYKSNFDFPGAIAFINRYEKQKAEVLERERERVRREEEERIRREEREKLEAEKKHQEELRQAEENHKAEIEAVKEEVVESLIPEQKGEMAWVTTYEITLTASEKECLERYMDSVGIEYKEV